MKKYALYKITEEIKVSLSTQFLSEADVFSYLTDGDSDHYPRLLNIYDKKEDAIDAMNSEMPRTESYDSRLLYAEAFYIEENDYELEDGELEIADYGDIIDYSAAEWERG